MYQVIYNLVNNAINYTGDDKKIVVRQRVNGSIARIEVIDSGEGIAKEELANVWERYYKVDKNHKRAVMGTGLGLSIVKNVLKLHKLQFGVESEVGKGTIFTINLPLKNKKLPYIYPLKEDEKGISTYAKRQNDDVEKEVENYSIESNITKPLILIVEDNSDILLYLKSLLIDIIQKSLVIHQVL